MLAHGSRWRWPRASKRFWKTPVNAPWELAPSPIFVPALKTKLVIVLGGRGFPRSSTMVMPGKKVEPNVLIVQSAADAPVSTLQVGAELLRREGLVDRAVDLFANEAENFGDAEIRRQRLRIGDRGDLAAGVEVLRETRRRRSRRRERWSDRAGSNTSAPECLSKLTM